MKRHNYLQGGFFAFIVMLIIFTASIYAAEESITVTTYYPSPYGVYSEMRLYPKAPPPVATVCDSTQEGLMYYDSSAHALMVCSCKDSTCLLDSNYAWISATSYWMLSETNLYPNNPAWNVGIGTSSPGQKLVVQAADTASSTGIGATIYLQSDTSAAANRGGSVLFGDTGTTRAMIKGAYETAGSSGYLALSTKTSADVMTEALRINSSGNVGIGTTSTSGRVEVRQPSGTSDPNIVLSQSSNTNGEAPKLWFKRAMNPGPPQAGYTLGSFVYSGYAGSPCAGTCTADNYARGGRISVVASQLWNNVNHGTYMAFEVANDNASNTAEAMRIAPSGNIGIGTTNPDTKLVVMSNNAGGSDRANQLVIKGLLNQNLKLNLGIHTEASPPFADIGFVEEAVAWRNLVLAKNGGNVGIGIDIPTQKLDVNGRARFRGGIQTGVGQISALCSGTPPVSCSNTSPVGTWYESCALSYMGGRDGVECEIVSLGGGNWRIDGRNNIGTSVKCGMSCIQYY